MKRLRRAFVRLAAIALMAAACTSDEPRGAATDSADRGRASR